MLAVTQDRHTMQPLSIVANIIFKLNMLEKAEA